MYTINNNLSRRKRMKTTKQLLALAIAGALVTPLAAQAANVEVYGKVRMSLNVADNGNNSAGQESSAIGVSSNSSRIGFKGTEDLGNGMTAMYQAESDYSFDDGFWDTARDSFVGLQGGFGKVRAGILSTPYKEATAGIDPFADTPGDYNAIIRHDTRAANTIEYSNKTKDGLSFAAAYITSITDDELPQSTADADQSGISISASLTQDKLMGTLAIENIGQAAGAPDDKGTKLGVTYKLDNITTIGGVYEMIDDGTMDNSTLYVSGTRKMNEKNTLKAAIGTRDDTSGTTKDGAMFIAVGITHQYTKSVEVYALYAQIANNAGSDSSLKGAMDGAGIGDETASSLSVGVNMSFGSK
jgi:predicted porin